MPDQSSISGSAAERVRRLQPAWVATLAYAVYYVAAWASGMRFSTAYLDFGWQMLPTKVLVDHPFRSTWYLHIQPPWWNLFVGLVLRVSPFPDAITLQVVIAVLGGALVWVLADIAYRVSRRPVVAVVIALVAACHPDLWSNLLEPRYEVAVSLLVAAIAWIALRRPLTDRRAVIGIVAAAVTLTMIRALFHPVWSVVIVGAVLWRCGAVTRRRSLAAVLGLVALPALVMVKNGVLFDRFSLSSWTGMNLLRSVAPMVDPDDLARLAADGTVSGVATLRPFETLEAYAAVVPPCTPAHSDPALTRLDRTEAGEWTNFNHECFLPIYAQAGRDARALARARPGAWARGRVESIESLASWNFRPSLSPSPVVRAAGVAYRALDLAVPGTLTTHALGPPIDVKTPHATVVTLACFAVALSPLAWWWRRRRGRPLDPLLAATLWLTSLTACWVLVSGVVGELGEQARFRSHIQSLCLVLTVSLAVRYLTSRRIRGSG